MQLYTVGMVTLLVLLLTSCSTNPQMVDTSNLKFCDDLTAQEERLYLANEASSANRDTRDTQNININNNKSLEAV